MAIDLKSQTPKTTLPATGVVFGADSTGAASASTYTPDAVSAAIRDLLPFSQNVDSIATLRTIPVSTAFTVNVLNYYNDGTIGGGGQFYGVLGGSPVDDGGLTIVASGGCWKRIVDGLLTVEMFGAAPSKSGDINAVAIQSALNALSSYSKLEFVDGGVYQLGSLTGNTADNTNVGNGTIGTITRIANHIPGAYRLTFTGTSGANSTAYEVRDPSNNLVGTGTVGVAFNTQLNFTVSAGTTAFKTGDAFTLYNSAYKGMAEFTATISNEAGAAGNVMTVTSVLNGTITRGSTITNNVQSATGNVSITADTNTLVHGAGPFTSNDVGKNIYVPGAGPAGGILISTITGFTSAFTVTLANNASVTLSSSSRTVTWNTISFQTTITSQLSSSEPDGSLGKRGRYQVSKSQYVTSSTVATALTVPTNANGFVIDGNGALIQVNHNNDGLVFRGPPAASTRRKLNNINITGPNVSYPTNNAQEAGSSYGGGLNLAAGPDNYVKTNNDFFTGVSINNFKYGFYMQATIGCVFENCFALFNQYGVYVDGGANNANSFFGCCFRENRIAGIYSSSLFLGTYPTANFFFGSYIESNIPYNTSLYYDASFSGTVSVNPDTGLMTKLIVTSVTGTISLDTVLFKDAIGTGIYIRSQDGGYTGGAGTYNLSAPITSWTTSSALTSNAGYPKVFDATKGHGVWFEGGSYDWMFDGVYFENQNYSIVVKGSSDGNQFKACRFAGNGAYRPTGVLIDGSGVFSNIWTDCTYIGPANINPFQVKGTGHVGNQLVNCKGFAFNADLDPGNVTAVVPTVWPDLINNQKNNVTGEFFGAICMPSQGLGGAGNISEGGTQGAQGTLTGTGTSSATLNVFGCGEIAFASQVHTIQKGTDATNVGNGTIGTVTTLAGAIAGNYRVIFTGTAGATSTAFEVRDPSNNLVGTGTVGTQFATQLQFTISAGATAFRTGDAFTIYAAPGLSDTAITTISGGRPGQILVLRNYQITRTVRLVSAANGIGGIILKNYRSVNFNKYGQQLVLYCANIAGGRWYEIGRNFTEVVSGTVTFSATDYFKDVTFSAAGFPDEPDTSYNVITGIQAITGSPDPGSMEFSIASKATTGFRINSPRQPKNATFTAFISNGSGASGDILNVTSVNGTINVGATLLGTGAGDAITASTVITEQLTGPSGGIGTYRVDKAQLVTSRTMTFSGTPTVVVAWQAIRIPA